MAKQSFLSELSFAVLEKYNVSLAEYYIMGTVGYGIYLPPESLAKCSFDHARGDPRGEVSVSEHLNAVHSCVEKGWLEVLSSEQCKQKMERMKPIEGTNIKPLINSGVVGFTENGYLLYRKVILEIFGKEPEEQLDSFWDV